MWHILLLTLMLLLPSSSLHAMYGKKLSWPTWSWLSGNKPKPKLKPRTLHAPSETFWEMLVVRPEVPDAKPQTWKERIARFLSWRPTETLVSARRLFFGPPEKETVTAMWQQFEKISQTWFYDPLKIPDIEKYRKNINSPRPSDGKTILTLTFENYFAPINNLRESTPVEIYDTLVTKYRKNIQKDILLYLDLFMKLGATLGATPEATLRKLLQDKYIVLLKLKKSEMKKYQSIIIERYPQRITITIDDVFKPFDERLLHVAQKQGLDYAAIDAQAHAEADTVVTNQLQAQKPKLLEE